MQYNLKRYGVYFFFDRRDIPTKWSKPSNIGLTSCSFDFAVIAENYTRICPQHNFQIARTLTFKVLLHSINYYNFFSCRKYTDLAHGPLIVEMLGEFSADRGHLLTETLPE